MIALVVTLALCAAPQGEIAFLRGGDQEDRRACVRDLVSGEVREAGPGQNDGAPRWSPDGEWLAFDTRVQNGRAIHVVRADGTLGRNLSHAGAWNARPAWSSEGSRLAYTSGRGPGQEIRVYDLDTDTETAWGAGRSGLMNPIWLPGGGVGDLIDYEERTFRNTAQWFDSALPDEGILLAIGLVGDPGKWTTDLFLVTPHEAFPLPEWVLPSKGDYTEWAAAAASRGQGIAFESDDGGDREIFLLTRKGAYDVSNHRSADWNPVWSPDGKWIAFESFRDGLRGVYRVHRDTNRVFPVAVSENGSNWSPAWSPDGKWIAYVSDRGGEAGLFITDVRGTESSPVAAAAKAAEYAPAWRPAKS